MNIEIFSCSGGMAEGFRRAGIHFDLVVDKDPDAVESYTANLGHRPVQMDARDLLRLVEAGWRPSSHGRREINLLVADPPCTPWSRAGKRLGTADERDMLHVTCELIRLLRPHAYLIGNVPGLEDSKSWPQLQAALAPLNKAGYCIADFVTLDAAHYGVPQRRVRPFWFGHLEGPCITWPQPTHAAPALAALDMFGIKPWVTCRDALGHLNGDDLGRPVRLRRRGAKTPSFKNGKKPRASDADEPAHCVTTVEGAGDGSILIVNTITTQSDRTTETAIDGPSRSVTRNTHGVVLVNDKHLPTDADSVAATVGAKDRGQSRVLVVSDKHRSIAADEPATTIRGGGEGHSAPGFVMESSKHPVNQPDAPSNAIVGSDGGGSERALAWPWDRPATTVQRDERIAPPGHHAEYSIMSDERAVLLSERAAAILQGFPETWQFMSKTKRGRWSMIGQAMPPPLAEAVARSVRRQMQASADDRERIARDREHDANLRMEGPC